MSLEAWTPLESVDDELLTLETAAILTLARKYRADKVEAAVDAWTPLQIALLQETRREEQISEAISLLGELLHVTGLRLPSAVNRAELPAFVEALRELSRLVRVVPDRSSSVRAAVGLLNLACEESMEQSAAVSKVFRSGLLDTAWQHVRRFVAAPASEERRTQPPEIGTPASSEWNAHDRSLLGDYSPWSWGVGPMFQTLGGWDATWQMARRSSKAEHLDMIRFWAPLPHLVLGPLGWSDPALGVARWILLGMPQSTPELSLLGRVWGAEALMYFSHPQMDWIPESHGCLGFQPGTSGRRISRIYESREIAEAFWGCGGLHMQVHLEWQMCGQQEPTGIRPPVYTSVVDRPNVVLHLDATRGWHTLLQTVGDRLAAELADPRIEVTIIAPPVGLLGTFRRSQLTGLWYSGSHEAHTLGHTKLNSPVRRFPSTGAVKPPTPVHGNPSLRHTNAAAFWLASELARRHAHYVLLGDSASSLRLVSDTGPLIKISRHAVVEAGAIVLTPGEFFAVDDKRKLIEDLETKLGLPARKRAAVTTRRTVMYRAMAHILAATVGDKATWDFVSADAEPAGAWNMTRDAKPIAFLTRDGTVSFPEGSVNLLERYEAHSRKMTAMIGEVFRLVMP